jgi:hypothetical protein
MIDRKSLSLAAFVLLSAGCATATGSNGSASGSAAASSSTAPTAGTTAVVESNTKVVCEYVKPSGSNIAQRECREVRTNGTADVQNGTQNLLRPQNATGSSR